MRRSPDNRKTSSKFSNLPIRELWFLLLFVAVYGALHVSYMAIPDSILRDVVYFQGITSVCASVINVVSPSEGIAAISNRLTSSTTSLEIVRGCDGSGVAFLLIAAILAFPAGLKHKLVGLTLGLALIYLINLIRVVGLYFVSAYKANWFFPVHTYFAPTLIVLVCAIYFLWWTVRSQRQHDEHRSAA